MTSPNSRLVCPRGQPDKKETGLEPGLVICCVSRSYLRMRPKSAGSVVLFPGFSPLLR